MATLQPARQQAPKEEASSSKNSSNPASPATKSKYQWLGVSQRINTQLIGSPLASWNHSPSGTPEKKSSDARRRRRESITSTSSSEAPLIQINDSSVNLDDKIHVPPRMSRSARPGRMTSASSLKKRKKKKKRSKSEAGILNWYYDFNVWKLYLEFLLIIYKN